MRRILIAFVLVAGLMFSTGQTSAHNENGSNSGPCTNANGFAFLGPLWTVPGVYDLRPLYKPWITDWSIARSETGASITNSTELLGGIELRWTNLPSTIFGRMDCPLAQVNSDFFSVGATGFLKTTMAHEYGHTWDLGHTGDWDALEFAGNNFRAIMSTCLNQADADFRRISSDDYAGLTFQTLGLVNYNSGFENGTSGWAIISNASDVNSGGQYQGSRRARFRDSSGSYRLVGDTSFTNGAGVNVDGQLRFRSGSTSNDGTVQLRLYDSDIFHPGPLCNDAWNGRPTYGARTLRAQRSTYLSTGASWQLMDTPNYSTGTSKKKFSLEVNHWVATSNGSGSPAYLYVDNVRIRKV